MVQKKRALRGDVLLGAEKRNTWGIEVTAGHTIEDVLDPGYFWNLHDKLRDGDVIEIGQENHEFFIRLYVAKIDRDTQSILTRTLEKHEWNGKPIRLGDLNDAEVKYKGGNRWCVIRGTEYLITGLKTEVDAQRWLDDRRTGRRIASGALADPVNVVPETEDA